MGFSTILAGMSLNPLRAYVFGAIALAVLGSVGGGIAYVKALKSKIVKLEGIVQNRDETLGALKLQLSQAHGTIQIVKEKGEIQIVRVREAVKTAEVVHQETSKEVLNILMMEEALFSRPESLKTLESLKWETK